MALYDTTLIQFAITGEQVSVHSYCSCVSSIAMYRKEKMFSIEGVVLF